MSPSSVQFTSNSDFFLFFFPPNERVFFSACLLLNQSEKEVKGGGAPVRGERGCTAVSHQNILQLASREKDECCGSVQGQSERREESADLLMEQRWRGENRARRTKALLCSDLYFFPHSLLLFPISTPLLSLFIHAYINTTDFLFIYFLLHPQLLLKMQGQAHCTPKRKFPPNNKNYITKQQACPCVQTYNRTHTQLNTLA